ncbi:MAG: porin [Pseudomonadales bacterium]|nr:porin [Pseudomonadales bacterium]
MKKTLLAVSVASALVPVDAMAAPSFYGKLNISVDKTSDYPDTALVTDQDDLSDAWFVSSNNSRLGVKGEEPLYNDSLSVIYQMEVGYDADGDSDDTFSTRNSFLGLGTSFGKIFAGRYDSVVKLAEGRIDQFNDTVADMDTVFLGQRRNSNTLNWESMDMGGIVVRAQVAPGEGETIGTAPDEETKDGLTDTWGLSATYQADALYGALAYESGYTAGVAGLGGGDIETLRGSFGMNLADNLQFGAIVEQSDFDPVVGEGGDLMSYLLSGRFGLSERVALKGQLGMLDSSDLDLDSQILTFGADYKLGDQTTAYGLASVSETDYDPTGSLFDVDESGMAFSVGMIHKF